jgi:CDP-4-dehydro-6-deoxyglucose reductase, E3
MSHVVTLTRSGRQFNCEPREAVLDAAMRQGVLIPYGCRNGGCGSCRARLVSGEIDYPSGRPGGLDERQHARGEVLLCQARPSTDVQFDVDELDAARLTQVRTLPARVIGLERVAHDVMIMRLKLPASERLQYLPGQYLEILLRDGRRRAFSIANAPHDDESLALHIRHVPGGTFSGHVFEGMKERALLRLHGPLGGFYLRDDETRPALLIAGGTGLAPMASMIDAAIEAGDSRAMHLYWGTRSAQDLYFDKQASAWAEHGNIDYTSVLSDPTPEDNWTGRTGFVHSSALADHCDMSGYDVYASGPPVMIAAIREQFVAAGLDLDHLYYDSFDYAYETGYDD